MNYITSIFTSITVFCILFTACLTSEERAQIPEELLEQLHIDSWRTASLPQEVTAYKVLSPRQQEPTLDWGYSLSSEGIDVSEEDTEILLDFIMDSDSYRFDAKAHALFTPEYAFKLERDGHELIIVIDVYSKRLEFRCEEGKYRVHYKDKENVLKKLISRCGLLSN